MTPTASNAVTDQRSLQTANSVAVEQRTANNAAGDQLEASNAVWNYMITTAYNAGRNKNGSKQLIVLQWNKHHLQQLTVLQGINQELILM